VDGNVLTIAISSAASVVAGLLVGFGLAEFSESRRDKRQRKRDIEARQEERRATAAQRRADFSFDP
jgi:hypothetical protein